MAKFKYLMLIVGFSLLMHACAKPEDPTEIQILIGEWVVEYVAADGQIPPDILFLEESRLHLDRNDTFLFINVDGRSNSGNWTASETQLTLNYQHGGSTNFTIVYRDFEKLHVYHTIESQVGAIELRYLFRRLN